MNGKKLLPIIALIFLLSGCQVEFGSSSDSSFVSSEVSSEISSSTESSSDSSSVPISYPSENIAIAAIPEGVEQYTYSRLYANDEEVPMQQCYTNESQTWDGLAPDRIESAVAIMEMSGPMTFRLVCTEAMNAKTVIRPLSAGIDFTYGVDYHEIYFTISTPGDYVVEPGGKKVLAIHLFIRAKSVAPTDDSWIYFGPGLHDQSNDSRLANDSTLTLYSGQKVYLDFGAVVRGRFASYQSSDITIAGPGVIDGSTFPRIAGQTSGNTQFIPLDFSYCSNIHFQDFSVLDPAGWTVNWYFVSNSDIDGISIITSRSNGDGISLQSNQHVTISDCFVRGWDDNLVVKNYPHWDDMSIEGSTNDITFERCLLWTDLAQSMEVGYETIGTEMSNITFRDITVLHALHKSVMSIHNGNNAAIQNVKYENITVEDASMGRGDAGSDDDLIQFENIYSSNWSEGHKVTALGSIDTVSVDNVKVIAGNRILPIMISGTLDPRSAYDDGEHSVSNVTLNNIDLYGTIIDASYSNLNVGLYVYNLVIAQSDALITGATAVPQFE